MLKRNEIGQLVRQSTLTREQIERSHLLSEIRKTEENPRAFTKATMETLRRVAKAKRLKKGS